MCAETSAKTFSAILNKGDDCIVTVVSLSNNDVKTSIEAKWDTGAFMSCVPAKVVKELSLIPTGSRITHGTFGNDEAVFIYDVDLTIPSGYTFKNLKVIGLPKDNPTDYMLIGMDVISQGDFLFSGHGNGIFSFRVPSIKSLSFNLI